ncbi:hypothetical protein M441DRAFT_407570 [Trichoderma asperellum CBS 433.97]|uniref:Uncharacterized protein n=1 Tax=Trichoderma asperellum (strain ATCC 204424 / CBS 433.97 / NBRC 101777) TaxID=1042311 RepID=A0A2T3Z6U6_TRIA4|nr:hypothetical protein M441DRAFT_407570 [Trichoderma asperellum CBS 433.97]PTB40526.1 hypothetical protein M441DRAFT_407570 [Trichoderma asperellum CBS 433.97]
MLPRPLPPSIPLPAHLFHLHQSVHLSIKQSSHQSIPPRLQNQRERLHHPRSSLRRGQALSHHPSRRWPNTLAGHTPPPQPRTHTSPHSHITSVHAGWHKRASEAMIKNVRRLSCPSAAGFGMQGFSSRRP